MKARTKIQLITTAFALTTALLFSTAIFWELFEQPVRLIDRELYEIMEQLSEKISAEHKITTNEPIIITSRPFDKYAISVSSLAGKLLLQTPLADKINFPFRSDDNYYFKTAALNPADLPLTEADKKEIDSYSRQTIYFRVYNTTITVQDIPVNLLVSRPIPVLAHEIKELLTSMIVSLAICVAVVPIIGFILANKILRPITTINKQINEITSSSLNKRIPVGANEDELQVLATSLNQMFDRLEFSFDRQREFIGNASHDLKSPLTSLMLGLEGLLSEDLPIQIQTTIEKHLNTTRRVSRLVHNLLELSRLEQHESFHRGRVDLRTTITGLLEEFDELIVAHGIAVTAQLENIQIEGDQEKISRVVINLLDNAIKYNLPANGELDVKLVRDDGWAIMEIANTGQLIPEESLPKVFDQFYRVEKSRSTQFGGSGLGLTIVKKIVGLHQGRITVHNSGSQKIVFTVHFPV
jgi:two-component system OmpR family sensor kinase